MEPQSAWQDAPSEPWRIIAERKIAEAIAEGRFRDLPGEGQPLVLDDNPFEPPEARLANRILKNAGFAPPWVEIGHDVDHRSLIVEAARQRLRDAVARQRSEIAPNRQRLLALVSAYLDAVEQLNESIDRFNLAVPIASLQKSRLSIRYELNHLARAGLPVPQRADD
ncbi:MAG TPA: DUF1992 domain-containing protein [Chloroflexota bacterium]|nr:DUF1992 domain-containing protein [Chloroflexota bacterium]